MSGKREILINTEQVRAYAGVLLQATHQAGEAVGDEFLVGAGHQDFCSCGELRSTIPWLDHELTEIHDQVIKGLNRIASAGAHALHRAVKLQQEEAVATTVNVPGGAAGMNASVISVSPQVGMPVPTGGTMTNAQLSNWLVTQQMTSQLWNKTLNELNTPDAMLLPEGIDQLGYDNEGNMHYDNTNGFGDSTDPYSPSLED